MRLHVSKDFFTELARKTWLSPYSAIRELVEDSYDADSIRTIVTVAPGYAVVEDDAGMDAEAVERFLTVGSIHKQRQLVSKRFNRPLTGRFGVGRMAFLAFFDGLKVRTRRGDFNTCFVIDEESVAGLASGKSGVKVFEEEPLERDGSEVRLLNPKSKVDVNKILRDIRDLPILRAPFFEVWFRAGEFKRWSLDGAVRITPREILGEKIPVDVDGVTGEITLAYRPLSEDERGILVIHGAHAVTRSLFGFSPSRMSRVSGQIRCDWLTVRFADKSAIIEDDAYDRFRKLVKKFLASRVLPRAVQVQEGMTYGESRVFKRIDKILSAIIMVEKAEEEGEVQTPAEEAVTRFEEALKTLLRVEGGYPPPVVKTSGNETVDKPAETMETFKPSEAAPLELEPKPEAVTAGAKPPLPHPLNATAATGGLTPQPTPKPLEVRKSPKPPRRAKLSGLGYEAVPYDDEDDEREFFTEEKTIFVNRGHKAYKKELKKGREFLQRHVLRLITSALASASYTDVRALNYANNLIAKALQHF